MYYVNLVCSNYKFNSGQVSKSGVLSFWCYEMIMKKILHFCNKFKLFRVYTIYRNKGGWV